ncbi:MAG: tryptophan 2,3-dioxygenase family protein [Crocinitomicaceae bacterium]|jgi:tryptophan 2,3-dioxygenase|nr:tryptophan 2,3-dioxygenase family protein [Crocinitomicaceae bacterium]MDP5011994.1 tryptophan 2,3-dioxygenase family protein [Crocinitomicaceae bacterium]
MEITPEIKQRLELLNDKYSSMGQDLLSYLDGLLYADTVKYWDYIELDTLLSLQKPRTNFPDEHIFIMYHQITELYFQLALKEFEQLADAKEINATFFVDRISRINRYFDALILSFDIMSKGMEQKQFMQFRMSLLPASGFQSAQYRFIEMYSTDFINLVAKDHRSNYTVNSSIEEMYEHIYWKAGATELATGKKTLTLIQFEERYQKEFLELGEACKHRNLWQVYLRLSAEEQKLPEVIEVLRHNDTNVNVNWPLAHYKSAVRYLNKDSADIAATGGTNWQKYLPPRFQKRIFYPALWSDQEKEEWGKNWVEGALV